MCQRYQYCVRSKSTVETRETCVINILFEIPNIFSDMISNSALFLWLDDVAFISLYHCRLDDDIADIFKISHLHFKYIASQ